MFKVGAIVTCFYIWSGGDMIGLEKDKEPLNPKKLIAKVLAIHKKEYLTSSLAISDFNQGGLTKKEEMTFLELEASTKKIRYFINASSCRPTPVEQINNPEASEDDLIKENFVTLEVLNQIQDEEKNAPKKDEMKEKEEEKEEGESTAIKPESSDKKINVQGEEVHEKNSGKDLIDQVTKDIMRGVGL